MRILLVEDESNISLFIKEKLQNYHIIDIASTGNKGLYLSSLNEYDLIILDIGLPDISGINICQQLRDEKISCPILFLSGSSKFNIKVVGLNSGADDFLSKPFDFAELQARINALLRRSSNQYQDKLTVGHLSLNRISKEIFYKKTKLDLRKREYSLLEFLLRNKNIVLSKDKIINNVWGDRESYSTNTLNVHLSRLRKKINISEKEDLILNVRGLGYVIRDERLQ